MEELNQLIKHGRKHGQVEAGLVIEEVTEVKFENKDFKNANTGTNINLGVRVTNGLKSGYAQTSDVKKWKHCLLNAVKLMKVSNPLLVKPELSNCKVGVKEKVNSRVAGLTINDLISVSKKAVDSALSLGVDVPNCVVRRVIEKNWFVNSEGFNNNYSKGLIEFSVECNKESSRGWDMRASTSIIDFNESSKSAAQMCSRSINPSKISTCKKPVVLDFFAADGFLNVLTYNLLADSILENRSFFKDKLGQKVVSEKLTINDNGLLINGVGSRPFDSEGSKTKMTRLIDNGVLKGFLHDSYTAKQMVCDSTGNCSNLFKRPSIDINNLVVKPGRIKNEELLDNSILIPYVLGLHTINYVSGDFSVSPNNAFLIKKGKWVPLKNLMISGNVFDLFNKVEAVGSKPRQDSKVSTPLIKFKDVQVIG